MKSFSIVVSFAVMLGQPGQAFELAQNPHENWPTYGGSFSNQRFSQLTQVTRHNVKTLQVKWIFRIPDAGVLDNSLQTTPLVVRGSDAGLPAFDAVMFVTSPRNRVFALDAATGVQIWEAASSLRKPVLEICCSSSNRGAAFGKVEVAPNTYESRVYLATLDARLWAFDATNGQPQADFTDGAGPAGSVTVADNSAGFSLNMAPLFIPKSDIGSSGSSVAAHDRDIVIIGISGAEFGTRGFVTAYDALTGDRLWRFFIVPAPGEFGSESWPTLPPLDPFVKPFLRGGGAVWMTPAYDPATGFLFITSANPSPNMDGTHRAGDNLFTNSVLALDVKTGKRVWHYQEVHHDLWDYDPASPPVLFEVNGMPAVGQAGKTGFFYILDRVTGEPIFPCPETPVPESPVVAPDGTPERTSPTQPICGPGQQFVPFARPGEPPRITPTGHRIQPIFTPPSSRWLATEPGTLGGSAWSPVALHADLGLAFISGVVQPTYYIPVPQYKPRPGELSFGGFYVPKFKQRSGTFTAIDIHTGTLRWQKKTANPVIGGALTTAGGLVFYGEGQLSGGAFVALDAVTGKEVFRFKTVGGVNAAPITFMAKGTQLVTVAAGGHLHLFKRLDNLLVTFGLP